MQKSTKTDSDKLRLDNYNNYKDFAQDLSMVYSPDISSKYSNFNTPTTTRTNSPHGSEDDVISEFSLSDVQHTMPSVLQPIKEGISGVSSGNEELLYDKKHSNAKECIETENNVVSVVKDDVISEISLSDVQHTMPSVLQPIKEGISRASSYSGSIETENNVVSVVKDDVISEFSLSDVQHTMPSELQLTQEGISGVSSCSKELLYDKKHSNAKECIETENNVVSVVKDDKMKSCNHLKVIDMTNGESLEKTVNTTQSGIICKVMQFACYSYGILGDFFKSMCSDNAALDFDSQGTNNDLSVHSKTMGATESDSLHDSCVIS